MKPVVALSLLSCFLAGISNAQSENADGLAKRAFAALSGNPAQAANLYGKLVALKPSSAEAWFYLGTSRFQTGQFAEARSAFQKAAALAPERGTVWAFLGLTELRMAKPSDALPDIRKGEALGLASDPKFIATIRNEAALACVHAADFACAVGQLVPLARAGYDPATTVSLFGVSVLGIPLAPSDLQAAKLDLVKLAGQTAWNLYGQHGDAANSLAQELVDKYPKEHGVHYLRGICLVYRDPATARAEFESEMRLSPGYAPARLQLAMLAMEAGNVQSALELSRSAVKLQPDNAQGHLLLGRSLLTLKQIPQAITELEAGAKLAPSNPQTHFFLGQAYRRAGRLSQANKENKEFNRLKAASDPIMLEYSQPPATTAPR
jgi:tetratricopeptide (TPR) repeat protein